MRTNVAMKICWLAAALVACSEDDGKRNARQAEDASAEGAGGSSGAAGRPDAAGGAAGRAGAGAFGGSAGTAGGPTLDGGAGAPTGDGSAGQAGAAGDAAAPDASAARNLYVSPTGDDAAPGTLTAPLLTVAHAASLASRGDRIVLLDGTFDSTTQPTFGGTTAIVIGDGVTVRAANARAAVLVGSNGTAFDLAGSSVVDGLSFEKFGVALRASSGATTITGTEFTDCGGSGAAPVTATGSADVTIRPAGAASYVRGTMFGFVETSGTASARIEGGAVTGVTGGVASGRGVFTARESSSIEIDAVTLTDVPMEAVYAEGSASVVLGNGTLVQGTKTPALAVVELQGASSFTMLNSRFENSYWAGISTIGSPTVTLDASEIRSSGSWGIIVNAPGPVTLNLTGTTVAASVNHQVELRAPTTLTVADSHLVDGTSSGLNVGPAVVSVSMRGTNVTGNGGGGIVFNASDGSVFDFGVVNDAGRNTFRANGASPGMLSYLPGTMPIFAVGNTWTASVQGADGTGAYSAAGPGGVLEITGPTGAGGNYQLVAAAGRLRLAENP